MDEFTSCAPLYNITSYGGDITAGRRFEWASRRFQPAFISDLLVKLHKFDKISSNILDRWTRNQFNLWLNGEKSMPYARLYYHVIWSTKNRLPLITPDIEKYLYPYLTQKASEMNCKIISIDGWDEHIHLVINIPPKLSIAEVIKRLKGASSHEFPYLYWQRGYGVLSISEWNLGVVIDYVQRQKEHHKQQSTQARLEYCHDNDEAKTIGKNDE